jgi:hypothetical protein
MRIASRILGIRGCLRRAHDPAGTHDHEYQFEAVRLVGIVEPCLSSPEVTQEALWKYYPAIRFSRWDFENRIRKTGGRLDWIRFPLSTANSWPIETCLSAESSAPQV